MQSSRSFQAETKNDRATSVESNPGNLSFSDAYRRCSELIFKEPSQTEIYYRTLDLCQSAHDEQKLNDAILSFPEMNVHLRSPRFYLDELYESGALERIPVSEDPDADEWVDDDSEDEGVEGQDDVSDADAHAYEMPRMYEWYVSDVGAQVLRDISPTERLQRLFSEQSDIAEIYQSILDFCIDAKTRQEVESFVHTIDLAKGLDVMTSFFLDQLEKNGGLVWDGGWKTTSEGKVFAKGNH